MKDDQLDTNSKYGAEQRLDATGVYFTYPDFMIMVSDFYLEIRNIKDKTQPRQKITIDEKSKPIHFSVNGKEFLLEFLRTEFIPNETGRVRKEQPVFRITEV